MEDVQIITLLFDRDETVLTQISDSYKNLYKSIIKQIIDNDGDIAECENDVLLAVWNSIPPNRPDNLSAYICKLARNISINRLKYNTRAKRTAGFTIVIEELSECIPDKSPKNNCSEFIEQKEMGAVLTDFLNKLDTQTRILFIRRYFYLESVASLAERYGFSENALSVKLFRVRKKLHKYFEREGIVV